MAPEPERLGRDRVALPSTRDEAAYGEPERLDHGGSDWRPPRWGVVVLAVVVLLGGLAWYADHRLRVDEQRALDACHTRLQDAAYLSDKRLNAMYDYIRPALSTVGGRDRQRRLMELMNRPARIVLPDIERADRVCTAVDIRGWHLTLRAQQHAATDYANALRDWVHAVAADGTAYFGSDARLGRLRTAAGLS